MPPLPVYMVVGYTVFISTTKAPILSRLVVSMGLVPDSTPSYTCTIAMGLKWHITTTTLATTYRHPFNTLRLHPDTII